MKNKIKKIGNVIEFLFSGMDSEDDANIVLVKAGDNNFLNINGSTERLVRLIITVMKKEKIVYDLLKESVKRYHREKDNEECDCANCK